MPPRKQKPPHYRDGDPRMTVLPPERDGGPAVNWPMLLPPLLIGSTGGFLASFIVGGGGLLRYAITGVIGLFLASMVLRALGLSLAIRNPLVAKIVTAAIGAAAVVLIARMIA